MRRRFGLWQAVVAAVLTALAVALGFIQVASDALNSNAAAAGTLPTRIPARFGETVYRALDRLAPASYVESGLARYALARNRLDDAQRYAVRLPASSTRDDLLAQIARARGRQQLALEYFLAAPDADAVQAAAERIAVSDPAAAYALERLLMVRLAQGTTHPDAVAHVRWRMGLLANREAWRKVPGSAAQRTWLARAYADFEAAAALAPLSERYAIADANQADLLAHRSRAEQLFRQAADIDPASADALAGLGVVAWESGDRGAAALDLERARALDPQSSMVRALERDLR